METTTIKNLTELNKSELVEIVTQLNLEMESPIELDESDFSCDEYLENIIMNMVEILYSTYGSIIITVATDKIVPLSNIYEKFIDED